MKFLVGEMKVSFENPLLGSKSIYYLKLGIEFTSMKWEFHRERFVFSFGMDFIIESSYLVKSSKILDIFNKFLVLIDFSKP